MESNQQAPSVWMVWHSSKQREHSTSCSNIISYVLKIAVDLFLWVFLFVFFFSCCSFVFLVHFIFKVVVSYNSMHSIHCLCVKFKRNFAVPFAVVVSYIYNIYVYLSMFVYWCTALGIVVVVVVFRWFRPPIPSSLFYHTELYRFPYITLH